MDEAKAIQEKISFIKIYDLEGAARLERLLAKKDVLKRGNVYGERFTDRQFTLVFTPLLDTAYERARVLELLSENGDTIPAVSEKLNINKDMVFIHIKEMMRKNLVEIAGHGERNAIFRRKT